MVLVGCDSGNKAAGDVPGSRVPVATNLPVDVYLEPPNEGEGIQFFMESTVPAGSEAWICAVYPMPIDDWAAVNRVEYAQTAGMHHMTLSTPSLGGGPPLEYGVYPCEDIYGQMMEDMTMFFGNQGGSDTMTLPEGVAANFPPGLDVVHEVHYLNVYTEPVHVKSYVNGYTIPQEDVVEGIWGGQVRDENLDIPAGETRTEWTRCVMNEDVEVVFLASHTHELGVEFTIASYDGDAVGDTFYVNTDWEDPLIVQYDPPLTVKAGEGFEYTCTFNNWRDVDVAYGLTSKDEMCNMTIVHMPQSMTARCAVVETSDGVLWE